MNRLGQLLGCSRTRMAVIGMVHVRSLPNTPLSKLSVQQLIDISCGEAQVYKKYGFDAICVENTFDIPYATRKHVGPELTAVMTRVCAEVKRTVGDMCCGVQLLAALNAEALAVALSAHLQFVRVEAFVFGHIADEGYMDACAPQLLRYRRQLNAEHILILSDIKKKHCSHAITSDLDVRETAIGAQFFLSDGVVITGSSTGVAPHLSDVRAVKDAKLDIPVLVGSGVTLDNLQQFMQLEVDAAIIGSHFKVDGIWSNELCERRIDAFMSRLNSIRKLR